MKKDIQPYQQGSLDGLCGLYSLINAYNLVNERCITKRTWMQLFHASLCEIGKERILEVLQEGMHINLLLSINKRIFHAKYPHIRMKRPFLKVHPTVQQIMMHMTNFLAGKQGVILLSYSCKRYGHWSVIYAETPHSYLLADSDNIKYLRKRSFQGKSPSYHFGDVLFVVYSSS